MEQISDFGEHHVFFRVWKIRRGTKEKSGYNLQGVRVVSSERSTAVLLVRSDNKL